MMDYRSFGIPFVAYPQSGNLRTSYFDDVLPREFAEQHLPETRRSNDNKVRAHTSRSRATNQRRSWLNEDSEPDPAAPAPLVRVPRPARRPRLVPMEFVLKELEAHLKEARSFYGAYESAFANMTQHLDGIASAPSLHMLWQDLLHKKFENTREKDTFTSAAGKISQAVEEAGMLAAVGNALDRDAAAQLAYERNLRKVNKLRVISDDIARLAKRALSEHAVDDLLDEIDMALRVVQSEPPVPGGRRQASRRGDNGDNNDRGRNSNDGSVGDENGREAGDFHQQSSDFPAPRQDSDFHPPPQNNDSHSPPRRW